MGKVIKGSLNNTFNETVKNYKSVNPDILDK
jgi:hypothetical protein